MDAGRSPETFEVCPGLEKIEKQVAYCENLAAKRVYKR
jgi:hypothetical protein